jgi:hypothetical protein
MRFAKLLAPAVCAAATVTMMMSAVTSASAATRALPTPTHPSVTRTVMRIIGFDARVAAEHGYEVRSAPGGKQYLTKNGSSTPDGVVSGPCGVSYVYEYGIGNRAVELYSGFSVIAPEVGGHWQIRLSDRGGTSFKNYNVAASANGIGQFTQVVGGLSKGPAQATVVGPASFAILDNGEVCYSGGPSATTTIT